MSIKQQIDQDLKQALLSGKKDLVTTLRGLKSAILYVEVAQNKRETGLPDQEVIEVFTREAKKRQESADLYAQGGNAEKQQAELTEKKIIEQYLPKQMDDTELTTLIDTVIAKSGPVSSQTMGKIIGEVKQQTAGRADGSRIAALIKERIA